MTFRGRERSESASGELGEKVATGWEELTNQNDRYGVYTDYILSHRTIFKGSFVCKYFT